MSHPLVWRAGRHEIECGRRTLVMGVLNVTPDSFSDGGRFRGVDGAVRRGVEMAAEGADLLDVGGESTRPGARPVPADEECRRVLPVVERLARAVDVPVSVDTRKAAVASAAVEAGASIVNDVSAGRDPDMFGVVGRTGAGVVLMHMRGDPTTMLELTSYEDVVGEVHDHLAERAAAAVEAGIERGRVAVDPGLGFAKTADQSLTLIRDIGRFLDLGVPVVAGPSRKSFVGRATGAGVDDRLEGTAAAVAWLAAAGVHVVRVHDVAAMVRVVAMTDAIRSGALPAERVP